MNEDKYLKKITKESKKEFLLTEEEKRVMRSQILSFVKEHPLMSEEWSKEPNFGIFAMFKYASAFAVLTLVIMFGVSSAANGALPGDTLYSVKTDINEKILGFFQLSDESRAQYEIQLAETRLEEIEKVSSKDGLDEKTKEEFNSLLNKHIKSAQKHSSDVENKNNLELSLKINSELEASLNAHKEILNELSKEKEKNKDSNASNDISVLLSNVDDNINKVQKSRQENEDSVFLKGSSDVKESAEGKLKAIENKINEASKFIEKNKDSMSEDSYNAAKSNLDLAKSTVEDGKKDLDSENYNSAFLKFQKAMRIAQETQISAKASINFKINVPKVKENNEEDDRDKKPKD